MKPEVVHELTRALLYGRRVSLSVAVVLAYDRFVEVTGRVVIHGHRTGVLILINDEQARELGAIDNCPSAQGVKPEVTRAVVAGLEMTLSVAVLSRHCEILHTLVDVTGRVVVHEDIGRSLVLLVNDEQLAELRTLSHPAKKEST